MAVSVLPFVLWPSYAHSCALTASRCPNYPPVESECVTNDTPTVAGLISVLNSLLQLPTSVVPAGSQDSWKKMLSTVPPVPMTNTTPPAVAPGEKLPSHTSNVENPELYTLHPYRVYSAAKGVPDAALLAFHQKRFPSDSGWCQVAPDAALAGAGFKTPLICF